MRTFKQELVVFRGEDFSIDKVLKNPDGSPFVISKGLPNPYLLISVTDTLYSQKDRYIKNYWLSLENYIKFQNTEIFDLSELKNAPEGTSLYERFDDVMLPVTGYYKGNYIRITADPTTGIEDSHVYYNKGEGYKYFNNGEWKDYEFRFVKRFSSDDTRNWTSQNYLYSIQLVAGIKTRDYLINLLDANNISFIKTVPYLEELTADDTSTKELYELAVENGLPLIEGLYWDVPIIPSYSTPILKPTKIIVKEYAQGDVIW